MPEQRQDMQAIAKKIEVALNASDLLAFQELLDPGVTWGPPHAKNPGCKNRDQVLTWYQRGMMSGVEGQVHEVEVIGDCLILALVVRGIEAARERGGAAMRWQVDAVRDGRVVEIVGFDDHEEAVAYAETRSRSSI
jgi:hypothetical protein